MAQSSGFKAEFPKGYGHNLWPLCLQPARGWGEDASGCRQRLYSQMHQAQQCRAARVCCRMLTEGGKIHLQSEPVPCFCFTCCFSPSLHPQLQPSQLWSPWPGWLTLQGDSERHISDRMALGAPPSAPQECSPGQEPAHTVSPIPLARGELGVAQDKGATHQQGHGWQFPRGCCGRWQAEPEY